MATPHPEVLLNSITPAMRAAVAEARPAQGLVGLVHGATLNALKRHRLVERHGWVGPTPDYALSQLGEELRELVRQRAELRLNAAGFVKVDIGVDGKVSAAWQRPGEDTCHTRAGAMRAAGLGW